MLLSRFMRVPVVPIAVVTVLVGVVAGLVTLIPPAEQFLAAPVVSALIDIDGVETDVAVAPDGNRYAVISSGNLWFYQQRKQCALAAEPNPRSWSRLQPGLQTGAGSRSHASTIHL